MRPVGKAQTLISAKRFSQKLSMDKLDHRIEPSFQVNALWQVWLVDENQMEKGRQIWEEFHGGKFYCDTPSEETVALFSAVSKVDDQKRNLDFEKTWAGSTNSKFKTPLVFFLGLVCCVSSAASWLDTTAPLSGFAKSLDFDRAPISPTPSPQLPQWQPAKNGFFTHAHSRIEFLSKIIRKKIWRIWTPSLLHVNVAHLGIQLYLFWIFARQIEKTAGPWKLMILLVLAAGLANCAQYFASGIYPCGLAGIACACAGFCHFRCHQFPWEGYRSEFWSFHLLKCSIVMGIALQAVVTAFPPLGFDWNGPGAALSAFAPICGLLVGRCLARVPSMGPRNPSSS